MLIYLPNLDAGHHCVAVQRFTREAAAVKRSGYQSAYVYDTACVAPTEKAEEGSAGERRVARGGAKRNVRRGAARPPGHGLRLKQAVLDQT